MLELAGKQLERVTDYKYLGVNIDSSLNFQTHRENLINRINFEMIYFKKIRNFLT